MSTNVDDRLLGRWLESQHRQERTRDRLARSSLPVEQFEDWALDLIADALSTQGTQNRAQRSRAARPVLLRDSPGRE
jgi:hypothetical protein